MPEEKSNVNIDQILAQGKPKLSDPNYVEKTVQSILHDSDLGEMLRNAFNKRREQAVTSLTNLGLGLEFSDDAQNALNTYTRNVSSEEYLSAYFGVIEQLSEAVAQRPSEYNIVDNTVVVREKDIRSYLKI